jgi:hypothetical protein
LQINVADNKPPIQVNATAGKATNLNADKLDGKDSTEFAAYKRTVVVSPVGTDAENGTALLAALAGITDASATKPYLLSIESGTYDLGTASLQMKEHVDVAGSGELNTTITRAATGGCSNGTVIGANNVELRLLTVSNTGGPGGCTVGIYNEAASPRLTHVTVTASGGIAENYGVSNDSSSPTMTNVTVTVPGGSNENNGVRVNGQSSLTIKQSTLSGASSVRLLFSGSTAKIADTQLVGPVSKQGGTFQCFNNYDENMAAVTCP